MASEINLNGFSSEHYFSRAWRLVTQEKGWWKPILIMGVALLVPIVGPLAVLGYQLEWARLLAWDVNEPMRRHDIHVGELIASGWRGFIAMLGWGIVNAIIGGLLSGVPGLGGLLNLVWTVCGIFISMMIMVAAIRATIYQKIGAGYSTKNLWEMAKRDIGGLARVWLIGFVASIIEAAVALPMLCVSVISTIPSLAYNANILYNYGSMMSQRELAFYTFDLIGTFFGGIWPVLLLLVFLTLFLGTLVATLTFAGLALWMRQFDVPAWGKSSDPLPTSVAQAAAEKDDEVPVAPVAPVDESVVEEKADKTDAEVESGAEAETEVEAEVIAPARAEESVPTEVFDGDAETSDDADLAKTNGDPIRSDEEETEE